MEKGFSLIEWLIASFLGLFIVTGILHFYLNYKQQYREQQALLLNQDSARLAAHIMRYYIQGAGYIGCGQLSADFSLSSPACLDDVSIYNAVRGYQAIASTWQPELPDFLRGKVKPGTDVVRVWQMDCQHTELLEQMIDRQHMIIPNSLSVNVGDTLLLANCTQADRFKVADVYQHAGQQYVLSQTLLSYCYPSGAYLGHLHDVTLYIRDTGRHNTAGEPVYALYIYQLGGVTEELVAGIDAMQVTYGVFVANQAAMQFVSASQVHDGSQVRVVRIQLVVVDEEQTIRNNWQVLIYLRQR